MKKNFYNAGKRYLRFFSRPIPEIAIVNNSGLFFTYATLVHHGIEAHPFLKVITPEFWLNNLHTDYENLDWGQTIYGLPWYAREHFHECIEDYRCDDFIRWGQMKKFRNNVTSRLENFGIPIYTGVPEITVNNDGYKISTNEKTFHVSKEAYFYNSFRVPDLQHPFNGLQSTPHTYLYTLPRSSVPDTIVVTGSGRSVIWLAQHFPEKLIACIIDDRKQLPLMSHEMKPDNLIVYNTSDIKSGNIEILQKDSQGTQAILISKNAHSDLPRSFEGFFVCAMGLKTNQTVVKDIPPEKLLTYPFQDWKAKWIASEDLPIGSLMEATLRWAVATGNIDWANSTSCFHEGYFVNDIINLMKSRGLAVCESFVDKLRFNITSLNPTTGLLSSPNLQRVIKLYQTSYQDTCDYDLSEEVLHIIESVIRDFESERKAQYRLKVDNAERHFKF